jgi:hypothetical protein
MMRYRSRAGRESVRSDGLFQNLQGSSENRVLLFVCADGKKFGRVKCASQSGRTLYQRIVSGFDARFISKFRGRVNHPKNSGNSIDLFTNSCPSNRVFVAAWAEPVLT